MRRTCPEMLRGLTTAVARTVRGVATVSLARKMVVYLDDQVISEFQMTASETFRRRIVAACR